MTVFDTARPVAANGRVTHFIQRTIAAAINWNDQRLTRRSLGKLTDRELDDIGLVRGDIESL